MGGNRDHFSYKISITVTFKSNPPGQNSGHLADDIFKCIFLNDNMWSLIEIVLKFIPYGPISNIPAMIQINAWRRLGDKPISEPILVRFNDAYARH